MKLFKETPSADRASLLAGMDLSGEGILLLDGAMRVVLANRLAREMMHLPNQSFEGVEFWELLPEETARIHKRVGERGLKAIGLYTLVEHDSVAGRSIEYRITREPAGPVVTIRDVTERQRMTEAVREAERRTKALFESNPNIMWVYELATTRILAANRAAQRFYGYRNPEFLELRVADLYPRDGQVEMEGDLPAHLAARPTDETELCLHRTKTGSHVLVEVARRAIDWMDSSAVLITVSDVTVRQLANDEQRDRNDALHAEVEALRSRLEQALHEHQTFNAALSQDLQAPLHIVDGFAKTLMTRYAKVLDAQGLHYLRRIQVSIERMARQIDDMNYLSRIPRLGLSLQTVDVAPLCRAIVDQLRKREPQRQVEIDLEPGLTVHGDPDLLGRALKAMIENAWKFTGRNPQAWIRIGTMPGRSDGQTVLFVSDNGAGFDSGYAAKLFIPFERLHSSADFPGTGLGLAIVKAIAVRHSGSVWAESTEGAGATFYMSLANAPEMPELQVPSLDEPEPPEDEVPTEFGDIPS